MAATAETAAVRAAPTAAYMSPAKAATDVTSETTVKTGANAATIDVVVTAAVMGVVMTAVIGSIITATPAAPTPAKSH
jgi:hypothetical protein